MNAGRQRQRRAARTGWRRYADIALAIAILGLLTLAAARLDRVATQQVSGPTVAADGDSLKLGGERIRLRGIDAPEFGQSCIRDGRSYACGREARQALTMLVAGRAAACEGWERDRYGRLLARCEAGGRDLAQAMVEAGWAITYGDYRQAEAEAREARRGLWAGTFETPQDWRRAQKAGLEAPHDWFGRLGNFLRQLLWGREIS